MGRPWSIVTCAPDEAAEAEARWRPLLERTGCRRLRIPVWGTHEYLSLEPGEPTQSFYNHDLEAEIRLIETPDISWDEVDSVLNEQMIFLPVLGVRPSLVTLPGFEPKTLAGGLDRLLQLGCRTELEVMFGTAGRLAAKRSLAILVNH